LGRSWGCPALSPEVNKEIIDMIKGGSVIYASA
ncbi:murein L,D-transpeptidase catalytic domain-containing protein, partial [Vibrio sp. 10N.222.49.C9]